MLHTRITSIILPERERGKKKGGRERKKEGGREREEENREGERERNEGYEGRVGRI